MIEASRVRGGHSISASGADLVAARCLIRGRSILQFCAAIAATSSWSDDRASAIVAETPLARPGTPAEIAGAVRGSDQRQVPKIFHSARQHSVPDPWNSGPTVRARVRV